MGTNFYLKRKIKETDRKKLMSLIKDGNLEESSELLKRMKDESNVHIGKRSSGWKFLWDANNFKYFTPYKESITNFLKSGQIVDEEGIEYTLDKFFNEEISSFLTEGIDLKEHYEKENASKSMYQVQDDVKKTWKDEHGIDINEYGEFYIEDWRFTIHTDFC